MLDKFLTGKVALVTGGSRGIGRAICERLASAGAHVYVNFSSNSAAADETVRLCQAAGGQATAIGFDVAQSEAVDNAIQGIISKSGKIDILINNAGIAKDNLLMRAKNDEWDKTIQVNLAGAFYCARAVARPMMKARWGRIINISSVVGEMGNAGQACYAASKAGLIGMTKAMAKELGSRNITVNCVTPGYIETDMTESMSEEMKKTLMTSIAVERIGTPQDIAAPVAFLCCDAAAYITGQILGVNGGLYM
ncbi:MAG: 3-oxoacyl-[acyl-carrier-protein] reductase [Oligoflexia bacterium]|nr:3-oxoacyl-[acyl-carrier-protein] reductase [Oligoflexia bacterium]